MNPRICATRDPLNPFSSLPDVCPELVEGPQTAADYNTRPTLPQPRAPRSGNPAVPTPTRHSRAGGNPNPRPLDSLTTLLRTPAPRHGFVPNFVVFLRPTRHSRAGGNPNPRPLDSLTTLLGTPPPRHNSVPKFVVFLRPTRHSRAGGNPNPRPPFFPANPSFPRRRESKPPSPFVPTTRHSRAGGNPNPRPPFFPANPSFPRRRESKPPSPLLSGQPVIPAQAGIQTPVPPSFRPTRHSRAGGNPNPRPLDSLTTLLRTRRRDTVSFQILSFFSGQPVIPAQAGIQTPVPLTV